MKLMISVVLSIILTLGFFAAVLYGFRLLDNTATPVTLVHPQKGITCATMVSENGVAISCWKEQS